MATENVQLPIERPVEGYANQSRVRGDSTYRIFIIVILVIGALLMFAPFAFLISSSLKVETQVFLFPIEWIPNPVRWLNYSESLTQKPFHLYFQNTMIMVIFN